MTLEMLPDQTPQCLGNPKGWRYFGLGMQRAETDAPKTKLLASVAANLICVVI